MSFRAFRAYLFVTMTMLPACTVLVQSDDLIGGTPKDGGVGPTSDGGGATSLDAGSCQGKTVCDDFEGAGTIAWQAPDTTGNASITVDGVRVRGGRSALHASRPRASGRDNASKSFRLAGSVRSCEFDVFATATSTDNFSAFEVGFDKVDAPYTSYSVSLEMGGGLSQYAQRVSEAPLYTGVHVPELTYGEWHHVRLDFEWAAASPAVKLFVDGKPTLDFPIAPPKTASSFVRMGIVYQAAIGVGSDGSFDNVMCTTD